MAKKKLQTPSKKGKVLPSKIVRAQPVGKSIDSLYKKNPKNAVKMAIKAQTAEGWKREMIQQKGEKTNRK